MKLKTKSAVEKIKILAVDDNPDFMKILERKLKQHSEPKIDIETLTDPSEALSKLERNNYDAMIVDYRMPEINGLELLKRVREIDDDLPFIIETSNFKPEMERKAYNHGATSVMRKNSEDEHYEGILRNIRHETQHYRACKERRNQSYSFRSESSS